MKSHARIGAEILSDVDFPYPVVPIVRHHHENWDGTGYPDALIGDAIPVGARILAVVDCFDALTSHRPYRRALPVGEAVAIIVARRGTMYDPGIVDAFREMHEVGEVSVTEQSEGERVVVEPPRRAAAESAGVSSDGDFRLALQVGASMMRGRYTPDALVDALCELPDVDTVAMYVVDERQQLLVPRAVSGHHAASLERLTIPIGERMSGWVAAVNEPMTNADAALDLFDMKAERLESALAIPCAGPDQSRAVITLYATRRAAFGAVHERLVHAALGLVANHASSTQVIDLHQDRPVQADKNRYH